MPLHRRRFLLAIATGNPSLVRKAAPRLQAARAPTAAADNASHSLPEAPVGPPAAPAPAIPTSDDGPLDRPWYAAPDSLNAAVTTYDPADSAAPLTSLTYSCSHDDHRLVDYALDPADTYALSYWDGQPVSPRPGGD